MWLMLVMLMFPQIVETIYSPALGNLADTFAVSDTQAAQTLSVYFLAFALGVVVWGIAADKWGRRPTMLVGLALYAAAAAVAMCTDSFTVIMLARAASAFGIAVGSVVTQTMLRDTYSGESLAKVFSLMGMGIAISPVVGLFLGGQLVDAGGYTFVFATLLFMAAGLWLCNATLLPETQTEKQPVQLMSLGKRMLNDPHIWRSAGLVALYNIALFSYYQLGPFVFASMGLDAEQFGYSGVVLGVSTLVGSYLNRWLLSRQIAIQTILGGASVLLLVGAIGVFATEGMRLFNTVPLMLLPMMLVVIAFGLAIPNVLSRALTAYAKQAGSAGAILGLMYYLMIGVGLMLAGNLQDLGVSLIFCGITAFMVTLSRSKAGAPVTTS
ncbi:MFS transporter [Photobacterium aphoticum]|nr:MFS transporter [Photobacterium aphoticum]